MDRNHDGMLKYRDAEVALRKESVDRNKQYQAAHRWADVVALRKESVDRNWYHYGWSWYDDVALRKESVDRNTENAVLFLLTAVALRKESVDRNGGDQQQLNQSAGRSPQGERG